MLLRMPPLMWMLKIWSLRSGEVSYAPVVQYVIFWHKDLSQVPHVYGGTLHFENEADWQSPMWPNYCMHFHSTGHMYVSVRTSLNIVVTYVTMHHSWNKSFLRNYRWRNIDDLPLLHNWIVWEHVLQNVMESHRNWTKLLRSICEGLWRKNVWPSITYVTHLLRGYKNFKNHNGLYIFLLQKHYWLSFYIF